MNPILKGVGNKLPNLGQFKNMFQMIQMAKNPQAALSKMIMNNPQAKDFMSYVDSFHGNYEEAFKAKAKEMGIDPEEFMNNFR